MLFFNGGDRLRFVDNAPFSGSIRRALYLFCDRNGFHIQGFLQNIKRLELFCSICPNDTYAVVISGFTGDFPCSGYFIMNSFKCFHDLIPVAVITTIFQRISKQMNHKVVNYIRRDPWRSKCDIYILGSYRRGKNLFDRPDIIRKIAVILLVCFTCSLPFAHQIPRKVFFGGFPSFVKAFMPCQRVLIDRPLQGGDDRLVIRTGNRRNIFNIHLAKSRQAQDQRIRNAFRVDSLRSHIGIEDVRPVQRKIHAGNFPNMSVFSFLFFSGFTLSFLFFPAAAFILFAPFCQTLGCTEFFYNLLDLVRGIMTVVNIVRESQSVKKT